MLHLLTLIMMVFVSSCSLLPLYFYWICSCCISIVFFYYWALMFILFAHCSMLCFIRVDMFRNLLYRCYIFYSFYTLGMLLFFFFFQWLPYDQKQIHLKQEPQRSFNKCISPFQSALLRVVVQVAVWVFLFVPVFRQRNTQHRRGEQEGEENKTENEAIQRASNAPATKKQRLETHKNGWQDGAGEAGEMLPKANSAAQLRWSSDGDFKKCKRGEDCIQSLSAWVLLTIKSGWTCCFGNWAFEQKHLTNMSCCLVQLRAP